MASLRPFASFAMALLLLAGAQEVLGQSPLAHGPDAHLPLEGTRWRLEQVRVRGRERPVAVDVAAWLRLQAGSLEGSGGCARLRGRYGAMGSALAIDPRRLGAGGCPRVATSVQLAMLEGLRRTASWAVEASPAALDGRLLLRDAEGQVLLRFKPDEVADLELGEWRLAAYTAAGQRVAADTLQPAVLTFQPSRRSLVRRASSGEALGSTGCNGIVLPYARSADELRFGELERTEAPCAEALVAQEEAMIAVLGSPAVSLALPPDRLILSADDSGAQLEFVSAAPLEGSTWQLVSLAGAGILAEPVTLRLLEGMASGAGPCGPYQAAYATDGQFITFSDLAGTAEEGCPDEATERALLRALSSAVLLDRGRPGLRLMDARGEVLARLAPAGVP